MDWTKKLIERGWDPSEYLKGIFFHNENLMTINHPLNFATEEEAENHGDEIMNTLEKHHLHIPVTDPGFWKNN